MSHQDPDSLIPKTGSRTTGISARLRASVGYDAINGNSSERAVCGHQMLEAAEIIDRLHETKERLWAAIHEWVEAYTAFIRTLDDDDTDTDTILRARDRVKAAEAVFRLLAATEDSK